MPDIPRPESGSPPSADAGFDPSFDPPHDDPPAVDAALDADGRTVRFLDADGADTGLTRPFDPRATARLYADLEWLLGMNGNRIGIIRKLQAEHARLHADDQAPPTVVESDAGYADYLTAAPTGVRIPDRLTLPVGDKHTVLFGKGKAGKSSVMLDWLHAAADAGIRSMLVPAEDPHEAARRIQALDWPDGLTPVFATRPPTHPDHTAALVEAADRHRVGIVVLDPLRPVFHALNLKPSGNNAWYAIRQLWMPLIEHRAWVVVHHENKDRELEGSDRSSDTRAIVDAAALTYQVFPDAKTGQVVVNPVESNQDPAMYPLMKYAWNRGRLRIIDRGSRPADADDPTDPRAGFRPTAAEAALDRIVDLLAETDDPMTARRIQAAVGGTRKTVTAALESGLTDGLLTVDRTGRYDLWTLTDRTDGTDESARREQCARSGHIGHPTTWGDQSDVRGVRAGDRRPDEDDEGSVVFGPSDRWPS